MIFNPQYNEILNQIEAIKPIEYGRNRNYIDGDVTYLSPYVSRGVISTKQILIALVEKGFKLHQIEQFVKELAWRDYFQRVWQHKNIDFDIKTEQEQVLSFKTPKAVVDSKTRIEGIDIAISSLYQNGYMHNHCRMYTASVVCNIAQYHWKNPAKWMYFHLLDGDWASNSCSWQWVAGSNSSKKYFANQDNVSKFTKTNQKQSYLDDFYNQTHIIEIPEHLKIELDLDLKTVLPKFKLPTINENQPSFIYNYYQMDPIWHKNEIGNRILLLEPSVFEKYPISEKCIDFLLSLGENITNLQIFVGEFDELYPIIKNNKVFFKEHPLFKHYKGIEEKRDWISESINGYFPSFFAFWKQLEKELKTNYFK